jgi:hypothetical protein
MAAPPHDTISGPRTPHSLALRAFHDHSPTTARATITTQPRTASHRQPLPPAPPTSPLPPTCRDRLSASPPVPPTFRAAGDNLVTPSQPASPSIAKPEASPNARRHARFAPNQTTPSECTAPTPPPAAHRNAYQDTPSIGAPIPAGWLRCRSPGTGAIMMKHTVAWAADNTPRDKVPNRLEEDVRLQDGRYERLVQWFPKYRAPRSPNMIVHNVIYETD